MKPQIDRQTYFSFRSQFISSVSNILDLEKKYMLYLVEAIQPVTSQIERDFDKAIAFRPFWINYAPEQRGRAPTGDAIPWLEVGETVIGAHIIRAIAKYDSASTHPGLPSGADIRFMTQDALIHLDIKITGPNDRADEIVASPNQISGDGAMWRGSGVSNSPVTIKGSRSRMDFQPELSPIYVFRGRPLLCLTYFLKGVYSVESLGDQPLGYMELICVPNGLLAFTGLNYNANVPGLYIPGKDVRNKKKKRVRVRMEPLASIAKWRRRLIWQHEHNDSV